MNTSLVAGGLVVLACSSYAQNSWTFINAHSSPGPRDSHNMVWDSESKRAVLYGSHSSVSDPSYYNSTWVYDPVTEIWTKKNPSQTPGARAEYGLAYNSVHDRVILFGGPASVWPGGTPGPEKTNDLWAYDLNSDTWVNRDPENKPNPTGVCRIAYDSESDKIIYFESSEGRTWAYDYTTNRWQDMNPPAPRPLPDWRAFTSMTYDSKHDRVLLLTPSPQNLWAYDYNYNTWVNRGTAPNDPIPNGGLYDLDYDSNNDKVLMYGDTKITWIYDWESNAWTNMNTPNAPDAHHHAIAFMPEYNKMLFYGGIVGSNHQTWEYQYSLSSTVEAANPPTSVRLYPNPACDVVHIESTTTVFEEALVSDQLGKRILSCGPDGELDVRHLANGIYTVRIVVGDHIYRRKLIISK